jgi:uncharacterized SAM-binding protein YcdF (DUF218 family)
MLLSLGGLPSLLLLPPVNLLVAATAGAVMGRRRGGRSLLTVGLVGLILLSLPIISGSLLRLTELGMSGATPLPSDMPGAIVILSGDQEPARLDGTPAWNVGPLTLEREQAGAVLARATKLPVLVTGGAIHPWSPALADLMGISMERDFGIKVRWQEDASRDTMENARDSAAILLPAGIHRVFVVTQAWHMRRALLAFRRAGLDPVAAPVLLDDVPQWRHAYAFIPSVRAWGESYYAVHELVGWAWYALTA